MNRHFTQTIFHSTLFIICACFFSIKSIAQNSSPEYLSISYIKLNDASKADAYEALLKYYGKAVYTYRFQHGEIDAWSVYEVIMPQGNANEYDLIVEEKSKNMQLLLDDTVDVSSIFKKVFPNMSDGILEGIFKQYEDLRKIQKKEIFTVYDYTKTSAAMPTYIKMNYVKTSPGKDSLFLALEDKTWMDFHQLRMKKGLMADWELDKKLMPADIKAEYDYLSVDLYNNLAGMMDTKFMEESTEIWTPEKRSDIIKHTIESRTIVRSEIWKLVDYIDARNTKP